MFIYLSKKIAIPNGIQLHCVSWNSEQGWIACGGEGGMLKVLKLNSPNSKDGAGKAASNLSMNQTLEGHSGAVKVVTWNENYRKLTTSDQNGLIIVWMLHRGMWFEEMINNRNVSVVRDMRWTADGQRICIVYEDGAVIVGSVDGNRLWGKELKLQLTHVQWSPDGRNILFCTADREVQIFDSQGTFISKLALDDSVKGSELIGIHWYDGSEGYLDPNAPSLAIGFRTGKIQLMRHDNDDHPEFIDTGLEAHSIQWDSSGKVLAVSGVAGDQVTTNMVQFYNPFGQHLRSLKVPGNGINALSWEGGGLRIALAVDSYIYFANIRPDYKWGFFGSTLVFAYNKPDRAEHCVMFWDTNTTEKYTKYVKKLLMIRAAGEHCVLATKTDDKNHPNQHILILCNAIGTPVDSKYINMEPRYLCMTQYHVIACCEDVVYIWHYRTAVSKLTSMETQDKLSSTVRGKENREKIFHIDDLPNQNSATSFDKFHHPGTKAKDGICCVTANESALLVGRESGTIHRYTLPSASLEEKYVLKCRPQILAVNCDSTKMSIIDLSGVFTMFDMTAKSQKGLAGEVIQGVDRKDAWDMMWSQDNPHLIAIMEKTRMYIIRGTKLEEPVASNAYLCSFSDLAIKAVLLDDLAKTPSHPEKEMVVHYETKSLRDTRALLANSVSIEDSYSFIEEQNHPRLWRILAEHALENLDFTIAEKAFVRCADYQGIQFVKKLRMLEDKQKQKAEVEAYFKRFDEAEAIYVAMDRKDLALDLRMRLGDWMRVVKLLTSSGIGDDTLLATAYNKIGDYFAHRQKWSKAAVYYEKGKHYEGLVDCYYQLEDYPALEKLVGLLPEFSPLLSSVGEKFASVGLADSAVQAYLKGGDVKAAIEACVLLNQWKTAVELAESHEFQQIENILSKYAGHLLEKEQTFEAIELYRRANHHSDAANLLQKLGAESVKDTFDPLRAKKLSVLAALEADRYRKKTLEVQVTAGYQQTAEKLTTLLQDSEAGGGANLENMWRPAEAYHFYLLVHRQLYQVSKPDMTTLRTAMRLAEYDDILDTFDVYAVVALTAFHTQCYSLCSKAFVKLEALRDIPESKQVAISELSRQIFSQFAPNNPATKGGKCGSCREKVDDWCTRCPNCNTRFPPCVATGKPIFDTSKTFMCRRCKHHMDDRDLKGTKHCPLCHNVI